MGTISVIKVRLYFTFLILQIESFNFLAGLNCQLIHSGIFCLHPVHSLEMSFHKVFKSHVTLTVLMFR